MGSFGSFSQVKERKPGKPRNEPKTLFARILLRATPGQQGSGRDEGRARLALVVSFTP